MKAMTFKTLLSIFGVFLMVVGLSACSNSSYSRGPLSSEWKLEMRDKVVSRITGKLDLDNAQQLKLQALADALQMQRTAFMGAQVEEPRAQIQALISGEIFDRLAAQSLVDAKLRSVQSNAPAVVAAMADFYDSLRPAQQQQVRDLMQRRHGWFQRG